MPNKPTQNKRRAPRRKAQATNPSASVINYTGPVIPPGAHEQSVTTTIVLSRYTTAASNGSGIMAGIISAIPSGDTNWSTYVAIYDEYRVLAMEVMYVPNYNDTYSAALANAPFAFVWDRDASGGLSSYSTAAEYESLVLRNTGQKTTVSCKMTGTEDAGFINTTAPTAPWQLFTFATGLTASTTYGGYFVKHLVQFRGRV